MKVRSVDEQRELVAALKHDLAKYVAWRSANYPDDAWDGPLTSEFEKAVQDDVLRTKGEAAAWVVWDTLTRTLTVSDADPELRRVARAVEQLRALEPELRAGGDALASGRSKIRDAQMVIRRELSALHRRLGRV